MLILIINMMHLFNIQDVTQLIPKILITHPQLHKKSIEKEIVIIEYVVKICGISCETPCIV